MPGPKKLYDADFNLWIESQVTALRKGQLENLDLPHLIEEVKDLTKREQQALRVHFQALLLHLLKWQFQPSKRSKPAKRVNSWNTSITKARIEIEDILADSPSLERYLPTVIVKAYTNARLLAVTETGIGIEVFPENCPYEVAEMRSLDFYPEN